MFLVRIRFLAFLGKRPNMSHLIIKKYVIGSTYSKRNTIRYLWTGGVTNLTGTICGSKWIQSISVNNCFFALQCTFTVLYRFCFSNCGIGVVKNVVKKVEKRWQKLIALDYFERFLNLLPVVRLKYPKALGWTHQLLELLGGATLKDFRKFKICKSK